MRTWNQNQVNRKTQFDAFFQCPEKKIKANKNIPSAKRPRSQVTLLMLTVSGILTLSEHILIVSCSRELGKQWQFSESWRKETLCCKKRCPKSDSGMNFAFEFCAKMQLELLHSTSTVHHGSPLICFLLVANVTYFAWCSFHLGNQV